MLVNKSEKIIMLENPKTGGRFREASNSKFIPLGKTFIFNDDVLNKLHAIKCCYLFHTSYNELVDYFKQENQDLSEWTLYTMIRNPYDKFASAYNFHIQADENPKPMSYYLDLFEKEPRYLSELQEYTIWFNPQSNWVGPNVKILRYENPEDWDKICSMMDIDKSLIDIKQSYELDDVTKQRIKNLYYKYDKQIFDLYNL